LTAPRAQKINISKTLDIHIILIYRTEHDPDYTARVGTAGACGGQFAHARRAADPLPGDRKF